MYRWKAILLQNTITDVCDCAGAPMIYALLKIICIDYSSFTKGTQLLQKSDYFVKIIIICFGFRGIDSMASLFDSIEKGLDAWGFDLCQPFSSKGSFRPLL